jgi:hypothetical protein
VEAFPAIRPTVVQQARAGNGAARGGQAQHGADPQLARDPGRSIARAQTLFLVRRLFAIGTLALGALRIPLADTADRTATTAALSRR